MNELDEVIISGPKVRPFTERTLATCPACGVSVSGAWRRLLRKLKGKLPEYIADARYCPGDKPPTEENSTFAFMLTMNRETVNKCTGIPLPHLHMSCKVCRAEWFMATKERP